MPTNPDDEKDTSVVKGERTAKLPDAAAISEMRAEIERLTVLFAEWMDVLDELVTHALGCGALDDDTPLWRKVAAMTGRDLDTGNALTDDPR